MLARLAQLRGEDGGCGGNACEEGSSASQRAAGGIGFSIARGPAVDAGHLARAVSRHELGVPPVRGAR